MAERRGSVVLPDSARSRYCGRAGRSRPAGAPGQRRAPDLDPWGLKLEQITVAGHPEPVPASEVAARLLQQRLDSVRDERGDAAGTAFEKLVGARIGTLLENGTPSIDVATMRAIVDYVEIPAEDESEPTGLGKTIRGIKDKLAQRGGPAR